MIVFLSMSILSGGAKNIVSAFNLLPNLRSQSLLLENTDNQILSHLTIKSSPRSSVVCMIVKSSASFTGTLDLGQNKSNTGSVLGIHTVLLLFHLLESRQF